MGLKEIIDQFAGKVQGKRFSQKDELKYEIIETVLFGKNHSHDAVVKAKSEDVEVFSMDGRWIVFPKNSNRPSRILILDPIEQRVLCYDLNTQFSDGLAALSRG